MSAILDREELTAEVANLKDSQGRTPLIICLQEGSPYMVRYGHTEIKLSPPLFNFSQLLLRCPEVAEVARNTFVSEGYSI